MIAEVDNKWFRGSLMPLHIAVTLSLQYWYPHEKHWGDWQWKKDSSFEYIHKEGDSKFTGQWTINSFKLWKYV